MKQLSKSSAGKALVIFMILTAVFVAQMTWWIVFQVRSASETKAALLESIQSQKKIAVATLNAHYSAAYETTRERLENSVTPASIGTTTDPFLSGLVPADQITKEKLGDSLYMKLTAGLSTYLLFIDRPYIQGLLSRNVDFGALLLPRGELARPDWLKPEMINDNQDAVLRLDRERQKRLRMFVMEGSFFLLLIMIGAYMIYVSLKKIRQAREEQLLFVHSITHELKIPITSLNLFLEAMKRRNYNTQLIAGVVPKMKEDIARLNQMIDNILQVRRLTDHEIRPRAEVIALSEELNRFAALTAEKIQSAGGRFKINIDEDIRIRADLSELVKVWESLIDNSLKYAGSDKLEISVELRKHRNDAEIIFADNGPGVPTGTEEKLFEPFNRGPAAGQKPIPGSGLGLYIARECIRRNGGHISIGNVPSGGCAVRMKFRLAR